MSDLVCQKYQVQKDYCILKFSPCVTSYKRLEKPVSLLQQSNIFRLLPLSWPQPGKLEQWWSVHKRLTIIPISIISNWNVAHSASLRFILDKRQGWVAFASFPLLNTQLALRNYPLPASVVVTLALVCCWPLDRTANFCWRFNCFNCAFTLKMTLSRYWSSCCNCRFSISDLTCLFISCWMRAWICWSCCWARIPICSLVCQT